jgi:hypothetical protein
MKKWKRVPVQARVWDLLAEEDALYQEVDVAYLRCLSTANLKEEVSGWRK